MTKEDVRFTDYSKDLDAAIAKVRKDGQKLRHFIHNVALSIITAWGKGQIRDQRPADLFNALIEASGYHAKPMAVWVKIMLPLAWSEETEAFYVPTDAKVNGDTFKACRDKPFWEVSPPPKVTPFDMLAEIEKLISRAQKKIEKGITEQDNVDNKLVNVLISAVSGYKQEAASVP